MESRRHERTFRSARLGVALAMAMAAATCLAAAPALAGNQSGGGNEGEQAAAQQALNQAKAAYQQAQNAAASADAQLSQARAALSQAQAQMAALQQKVDQLNAEIGNDQAQVSRLDAQIAGDKAELSAYIRSSYENGGSQTGIAYLIDAQSIGDLMARLSNTGHVAEAVEVLLGQISGAERQVDADLAQAETARQQTQAAQEQEATQEAIIAADEATAAEAAAQANSEAHQAKQAVNSAQSTLESIEYQEQYGDAAAAKAQAQANGTVYLPVDGPIFTEDTDLLLPSGEDAATINSFLAGTALAGLGDAYMEAEQDYGVSALYLVAHSIEESGWGTSALAQQKNNLFGWDAYDADPFGDGASFPSFSACILYVAQAVKNLYLVPSGPYYHGPTLRGMNVDYATDPLWAAKIAAIADTIPLPSS